MMSHIPCSPHTHRSASKHRHVNVKEKPPFNVGDQRFTDKDVGCVLMTPGCCWTKERAWYSCIRYIYGPEEGQGANADCVLAQFQQLCGAESPYAQLCWLQVCCLCSLTSSLIGRDATSCHVQTHSEHPHSATLRLGILLPVSYC